MTQITRTSLLLTFNVGLVVLANPHFSFSAEPISVSIALPAPALDLSDLDARDAFNRRLRSAAIKQTFERLWVKSLNQSILNALTPVRLRLLSLLNSTWDGFAGRLQKRVANAFHSVTTWFQSGKKQNTFQRCYQTHRASSHSSQFVSHQLGNSFVFLIGFVISTTHLLR